uniref:Zona pellucida sperm-binding protein 4 n=1 Tax=Salarias fasciatus TaxID=181472 RepID=A0A672JGU7_SALFA
MARRWSITSLAVLALLACLVERDIEAKPQHGTAAKTPWNPQNPPSPPIAPKPPTRWQYPNPPNPSNPQSPPQPGIPSNPQPSSVFVYPQNPWITGANSVSRKPQTPLISPKPQNPQISPPKPQNPQISPPRPQNPQISPPRPQNPLMYDAQSSPPGSKKVPQNPSPPQNPSLPPPRKKPYPQTAGDQSAKPPQTPQIQRPPPVLPPPVTSCEVDDTVRVPCGPPGTSRDECEALSCCHDGRQCYFGKAVTVQCTKDGQFIVVVAKDATLPKLNTDTISLLGSGPGCSCVDSNSAFAIYQFPVSACGTLVMEENGVIVYENSMSSSFEVFQGPRGDITRDSLYELMFQCRYIGQSVEVVLEEFLRVENPLPVAGLGPLRVGMRLGNGQCLSKGCDELSVAYSSYYTEADYPIPFVLRDPVYVEVLILDQANPNYVLTLDRCWATTCEDAYSLPQWDILINGCPNQADTYRTALVPVPTTLDLPRHYRRFVFQMFAFVEQNTKNQKQEVRYNTHLYIHCSTTVCVPSPSGSCEPICMQRSKTISRREKSFTAVGVVIFFFFFL